ncbi:hypothetical protein ACTXT7_001933 [Hymenolepis weldensis]
MIVSRLREATGSMHLCWMSNKHFGWSQPNQLAAACRPEYLDSPCAPKNDDIARYGDPFKIDTHLLISDLADDLVDADLLEYAFGCPFNYHKKARRQFCNQLFIVLRLVNADGCSSVIEVNLLIMCSAYASSLGHNTNKLKFMACVSPVSVLVLTKLKASLGITHH